MYFTSEDSSNHDQERIEELLCAEIDSLKDDVMKAEREVSDLKRMIYEKEITIITLQFQCENLDEQLKVAENAMVQNESLISQLSEQKRDLKNTLRQIKVALEHDNATLKESFENSLRNEAELRKKLEAKESELNNIVRRENEAMKDMTTNEFELKNQMKQMMDTTIYLKERLRQFENENENLETSHNLRVMRLKQRHDEMVEQMNSQIQQVKEKHLETEKEYQRLKSLLESLQRANVKSSKKEENSSDNSERADKPEKVL